MIATSKKCSLSNTVNHDSCSQGPTKQEHRKEEEGGGSGAKRPQCWLTIIEECDLKRKVAMKT